MRTSCAITDRGGGILRSERVMYVNDGLMVASARNHRRRRSCRGDYTAIGIYWLQVWCGITDRDGSVYDTRGSSAAEVLSGADGRR